MKKETLRTFPIFLLAIQNCLIKEDSRNINGDKQDEEWQEFATKKNPMGQLGKVLEPDLYWVIKGERLSKKEKMTPEAAKRIAETSKDPKFVKRAIEAAKKK